MENRFSGLKFDGARKLYRSELMKNHPDHGGSEEETKKIVSEFDDYLNNHVRRSASEYADQYESEYHYSDRLKNTLQNIVGLDNVEIEIIGVWIYVFNSFEVRDYLKELGFWFSKKHKAWIFSGTKKRSVRTRYTTEDVRNKWGSEKIKKNETERIA